MAKSKQVGIGIVGMGFMGLTHLQSAQGLRGGRVVGIVTKDPKKARGDFRGVRGNFGSGGARMDLKGISVHAALDSLLADPRVELVDICLPSYLHAPAAIRCLASGKHVLVEKPIALTPADARRMLAEAKKRRRLILVGQVLKFFPEFALLSSAVEDSRWGELLALHLRRRIAAPSWGAESWFGDPEKSGGMVIDLHIHDTDFIVHLFGKPRAVSSDGLVRSGRTDFIRTTYRYGRRGAPLLSSEAGWINAPGLAFTHGYDAYFEKATLHYDSSRGPEPLISQSKGLAPIRLEAREAFRDELEEAARAVRTGKVPPRLSAQSAALSLEVCRAEEKSAKTGRMVIL